jgi:acyl-CoA thioester hydrolase
MLSYTHHLTVPQSAIDANGHVNNVMYVQWMQEAAIAHSDAVGGTEATRKLGEKGATWVVRRHEIEYRRPAMLGDQIEVRTWIIDCRRVSSRRGYEFHRPSDGVLLERGQTDWVLLDLATLHPLQIPDEIQHLYNPPESPATG